MFTDSSAEASALGSGPRGRRFKSALSEKRPSIVIVQLNRGKKLVLHLKLRFFRCFFVMNVQLIAENSWNYTFHCTTLLRKFLLCKTIARQTERQPVRTYCWWTM